ncbi:MAG: aspartate aminotransferase family protein [Betaproteobacteria bacterium]|nr:aspartate aminotransferase family protein [Candidatus Fonsibacter lacus]
MSVASPHVMPTYGRLPIALSHGQGVHVWDTNNRRYLDALGGIAVNTLGHAHPELVAALREQVGQLIHCSNYYHIPHQETLAAELVRLSGMTNVFFCSSGLEANEAAIKIARKFGHGKGIERPHIVVYEQAFHGRSLATLSATANPKIQQGFGPLVEGFIRAPINQIEVLRDIAKQRQDVAAVFFEAIQGEGGVHPLSEDYMREVRALCDANDWLLMIDEVQCGIGRTGKWFAHQWAGIVPDVMPLAKGLGSGVPIGAVVAGPRAASVLQAGDHGSTFGGNPLATRAGVETLRIMQAQDLLNNAAQVGSWMLQTLGERLQGEPGVVEIRGKGMMIGIELDRPCGALVQQAADAGLLLSVTAERVVRMVPPLIMTQAQAQEAIDILCPLIQRWLRAAAN